jgi:hypothetical protein
MRRATLARKRKRPFASHLEYYASIISYQSNDITGRLLSVLLRFRVFRRLCASATHLGFWPSDVTDRLESGVARAVRYHPPLSRAFRTGRALIVYYSVTGNTEKVAMAIKKGVERGGLQPVVKEVSEASNEELYRYDLLCLGSPVIHALPPEPVMRFIIERGNEYRKRHFVRIDTQPIPGKKAVVFVTFSGPHIGVEEAVPAGKYLRQALMHLGFEVEEWYVVAEFHGWKLGSTRGRLGDIRGRPNAEDLANIEERTTKLVKSLRDLS